MTDAAEHDLVLVVDFGAQYAQLIARRVREARVYSEIVPHTMPVAEMLAREPKAIILSGGPSSVYAEGAPGIDPALFTAGVPVFGMCYGFQLMAQGLGGEVAHTGAREYGRTPVTRQRAPAPCSPSIPAEHTVWMSHGDSVTAAPGRLRRARLDRATPVAAFEDVDRGLAGVQWHPEVLHTEHGQKVLEHFLLDIAGCRRPGRWSTSSRSRSSGSATRSATRPGDLRPLRRRRLRGRGRDRAAGDRRPADLRLRRPRADAQGRDRAGRARLRGRDRRRPGGRRRRGAVPRRAGRRHRPRGEAQDHRPRVHPGLRGGRGRGLGDAAPPGDKVAFLVQGTLYPDVVESGGGAGTSNIKSHHNVGGLPDDLEFELVEPLRTLFKDEVRLVGEQLGLPAEIVWRQPFPGPGPRHPDHRRGHPRAARHPARGRRDRPRGAHPRRPRPRHLAVPGRAARRRPLGRRPGRRPHLRPPGRAAPGHLRGRDDRRLGAAARTTCSSGSRPGSPTRSARSTG